MKCTVRGTRLSTQGFPKICWRNHCAGRKSKLMVLYCSFTLLIMYLRVVYSLCTNINIINPSKCYTLDHLIRSEVIQFRHRLPVSQGFAGVCLSPFTLQTAQTKLFCCGHGSTNSRNSKKTLSVVLRSCAFVHERMTRQLPKNICIPQNHLAVAITPCFGKPSQNSCFTFIYLLQLQHLLRY